MEKNALEILEQIKSELDELKEKAAGLERRISEIETGNVPQEPLDILLDDEISFVIPKRREELGSEQTRTADEIEPVCGPETLRRWQLDAPAPEVQDILSAIPLKQRSIFINTLFKEDARLFMDTVAALNAMTGFAQAEPYLRERFPQWKPDSDTVYNFMMAIRRKLR